jgi:serine/threonine protein kinase
MRTRARTHARTHATASLTARCAQLVAHCHLAGIMHRDIKAENLVYRTRRLEDLVVIDFGTATFFKPGQARAATTRCEALAFGD